MTAVPISRQVVDGDAVLADSQCTCIFQLSCEWYFINFVGKFGIHSGMLFELPLKKKNIKQSKHIITKVFLFLPKYNTYAFSSSINVRCIGSCKESGKRLLPPPPPPWIHPERVWDLAIINKLLRIMGTYFLPNFGEIHYVISER